MNTYGLPDNQVIRPGELVGVRNLMNTSLSKRDLFLFDKIGTLNLPSALKYASAEKRADLEYLLEAGILIEANYDPESLKQRMHVDSTAQLLGLHASIIVLSALLKGAATDGGGSSKHRLSLFGVHGYFTSELRLVAADLERQSMVRAVPILPFVPSLAQWDIPGNLLHVLEELVGNETRLLDTIEALPQQDQKYVAAVFEALRSFAEQQRPRATSETVGNLTDVVEVVLHSLPLPSDTVPLEKIIDFRSSREHANAQQRLRHWMREVTKADKTPVEIAEELEYLLATYQEHVERSRIEAEPAIVESVLTLPFEIAEHIVKLKWGEAAKKLFTVRRRRVALLKAEATAPGREVAYVLNARRSFDRSV